MASLWVDIGRGLVHEEDGVVAEDGPGEAHELPLPHAEVGAALGHGVLQPLGALLHHLLQLHLQNKWGLV